jgi:hypothetical protein
MKYILSALLLTGCCSAPIIHQTDPIILDSRILEKCKPQVLPESSLTYELILENVKDNSIIYKECSAKNDAAITLIKKLTNQKDK